MSDITKIGTCTECGKPGRVSVFVGAAPCVSCLRAASAAVEAADGQEFPTRGHLIAERGDLEARIRTRDEAIERLRGENESLRAMVRGLASPEPAAPQPTVPECPLRVNQRVRHNLAEGPGTAMGTITEVVVLRKYSVLWDGKDRAFPGYNRSDLEPIPEEKP